MKKLMMLVLICMSIFTYSQSYANGNDIFKSNRSSRSVKTQASARTHSKAANIRKNKRQRGNNYYKYANSHAYLKYMGKAINGR